MKKYDYEKAKKIIKNHENEIVSAALGMREDWFWTAENIWEDGGFVKDIGEAAKIGGIDGSGWSTPVLTLMFKDGVEKICECYTGDSDGDAPTWLAHGVLSSRAQDEISKVEEL